MKNTTYPQLIEFIYRTDEVVSVDPAFNYLLPIIPHMGGENTAFVSQASDSPHGEEQQETTVFTSDAIVVEDIPIRTASLPSLLISSSINHNSNDIITFLAKPVSIATGALSISDPISTPLLTLVNPNFLTSNALVQNKLAGFLGFRATTVLRWIINATPFHMGRYMLTYIPTGGLPVVNKPALIIAAHLNTLMERTQLHRIELDVTCDTEGIIKIPFNSALNYFPLNCYGSAEIGWLGQFNLFAYSPLQTLGGSATVGYTIYAHFEDVELIGAAVPQMGTRALKGKSLTEKESEASGVGPVSSVTTAFANAARVLSVVPGLSVYASSTAWALDIVGGVAKAFGFSKPANLSHAMRVGAVMGLYMGNVDGVDQSVTLAASSENTVAVLPGFAGTDIDEMDISHIAQIPAWYSTIVWAPAATAPSGTVLALVVLNPRLYTNTRVIVGREILNLTPVAFVSSQFQYWRGSLKFTFKFVKTIFHSGRISICFSPFEVKNGGTSMNYSTSDYVHREIIDIRTCNEISFTIPYISTSPWLSIYEPFGQFTVFVLDPLTAPSNVPSSIQILCEVAGGPDIEFAFPISVSTAGKGGVGLPVLGIAPQMGEEPCSMFDKVIGSATLPEQSLINSEACVGEKIMSFRALLKIFRPQRLQVLQVSNKLESVAPFAVHFTTLSTGAWVDPDVRGDLIDIISSFYLYSRGSMRYKKVNPSMPTGTHAYSFLKFVSDQFTGTFLRSTIDLTGTTVNVTELTGGKFALNNVSTMNGVIEVTVPQYTTRHSRLVIAEAAYAFRPPSTPVRLGSGLLLNTYFNLFIGDYPTNTSLGGMVNFRAAGDDFALGGFISTVPLYFDQLPGLL